MLRSFLSIGVPVKPKNTAFGSAVRRFAASEPYCVRCASSVSTKTFDASVSTGCFAFTIRLPPSAMPPTSWNFCTVVITVRPLGPLSSSRRSRTLSARTGFGKPHARKVRSICSSRSRRSVTITSVGFSCRGSRRSLSASQSMVSDLPLPCVAHTTPPRSSGAPPLAARATALFTAPNCW